MFMEFYETSWKGNEYNYYDIFIRRRGVIVWEGEGSLNIIIYFQSGYIFHILNFTYPINPMILSTIHILEL